MSGSHFFHKDELIGLLNGAVGKTFGQVDEKGVFRKAAGAPNLPKARDHPIFFRGTGRDGRDRICVDGVEMLRQSYWIRGAFLARRLREPPPEEGGGSL